MYTLSTLSWKYKRYNPFLIERVTRVFTGDFQMQMTSSCFHQWDATAVVVIRLQYYFSFSSSWISSNIMLWSCQWPVSAFKLPFLIYYWCDCAINHRYIHVWPGSVELHFSDGFGNSLAWEPRRDGDFSFFSLQKQEPNFGRGNITKGAQYY